MTEPLSAAELAEIRARVDDIDRIYIREEAQRLLAEVERLQEIERNATGTQRERWDYYTAVSALNHANAWTEQWRRKAEDLESQLAAARSENDLLTHKIITCGVAAHHPNPNLTRTGAYASKWDSPQAEDVRMLRDRADTAAAEMKRSAIEKVREWVAAGLVSHHLVAELEAL